MRTSTGYVQLDPAVIEQARQMDLLSYLKAYEPNNLKRVAGNVYCTAEHDSLKISNGKWYWWSRGVGGVSALDYLIKVKEYGFVEAVETLTGNVSDWKPPPSVPKNDEPKVLLLPPKNKDNDKVIRYLFGRGIDYPLILDCISKGSIYESADYHNAVFIGKDEQGTPRYATLRSTNGSFKRDATGSDKRYSFRLLTNSASTSLHLFESAVDLLSYTKRTTSITNRPRTSAKAACQPRDGNTPKISCKQLISNKGQPIKRLSFIIYYIIALNTCRFYGRIIKVNVYHNPP